MCPDQSVFFDYEKIDGGQLLLGNNKACSVVGLGSVKFQMKDGTRKMEECAGESVTIQTKRCNRAKIWKKKLEPKSERSRMELCNKGLLRKEKLGKLGFMSASDLWRQGRSHSQGGAWDIKAGKGSKTWGVDVEEIEGSEALIFDEAVKSIDGDKWKKARQKESE
ncbi:hypothetical protein TIFTF001_034877 [Ficus carica]|uniref:Retrovirus-related Pol polyprotein from transposon TNT 1-94-like beta-barrel domain-containing protein n=1 Tax=Ficus carica TaxID=3494 RepID=A0AA88E3P0_FICCA|nr:hypothetical protein TIFTF001_034854 [Ficus carica]GMN65800.1 hypothetical protein TIFTF001_034877 [Ficus carica]